MARYSTLAVDTDAKSRNRLKQATASISTFGRFVQAGDFREARAHLSGETLDVIFLSDRLGMSEVMEFIKVAKANENAQDAAFIIIAATQDEMATMVARNMIGGADGFLCEPYSVDSLSEITDLAARVKKERSDSRERAAMAMLIKQAGGQVCKLSQLKKAEFPIAREMKKLKQMCEVFEGLEGPKLEMYFDMAIKYFEGAQIPPPLVKEYKGASSRVQRRMEKKAIEKMIEEEGGEAASDQH